jgi:hypothetical protein
MNQNRVTLGIPFSNALSAQTGFTQCAREAGVQLDVTGLRSIGEHGIRTHEAFDRCMERYRRTGQATVTSSISPTRVSSALPAVTAAKTAVAGQPIRLNHFAQVNPDCSVRGVTQVRILQQPRHGRVSMTRATDFAAFRGDFARCSSRQVPGTTLSYTARPGFVGTDTVRVICPERPHAADNLPHHGNAVVNRWFTLAIAAGFCGAASASERPTLKRCETGAPVVSAAQGERQKLSRSAAQNARARQNCLNQRHHDPVPRKPIG